MPNVHLADRSVVSVDGAEAADFLQGLVTCDVSKIAPGGAAFGALLTPQGKILFDFFVVGVDGGFLLDAPREKAADLVKRLGFYRLRAKIALVDLSEDSRGEEALAIVAVFGDSEPPKGAMAWVDPRNAELGRRAILPLREARRCDADRAAYDAHRIACGAPQGGTDFAYGDAFPHETNMDLLNGVAFDKGCYVGQEVVSRMQHRGLARKRIVRVTLDGQAAPGAEIRAGQTALGVLGGVADGKGLATIRTDRLEEAGDAPLTAGDARVTVLR